MLNRSMLFAFVAGCLAAGCVGEDAATDDPTGTATEATSTPWQCANTSGGCSCAGSVAILPVNIDISNVSVLSGSQLNILSNDLNNWSILNGGLLNNNSILNGLQLVVLDDFLNKFFINVTDNDVDVCTTVLGVLLCK